MRVLIIDDHAREEVKRVRDFAEKFENYYIIGPDGFSFQRPPGDDPRHVARLDTYRCAFSITRANGKFWRHLSVSVPGGKYPNVFATFTIAQMFGFTGWDERSENLPQGWRGTNEQPVKAIVISQEVA
jgi:hypothetical protein